MYKFVRELFQFAPPRGGRPEGFKSTAAGTDFNSRPREGGDQRLGYPTHTKKYFNSRPREGGDQYLPLTMRPMSISIRAPARGATKVAPGWKLS